MVHLFLIMLILFLGTPAPAVTDVKYDRPPCWIADAASVDENVWLLCDRDEVFLSIDSGATWKTSQLPQAGKLRSITFIDSRRGFIAGDRGTFLATEDGGVSWSERTLDTNEDLWDIHFVADHGWMAGYGGVILQSKDGGKSWRAQLSGTSLSLESIFFFDQDHGWAVGWNGIILRTTDGGQNWDEVNAPAAKWSLSGVYFQDVKNGWAVGFMSQLLRTRDGGLTWEAQMVPVRDTLTSVLFEESGQGWISAGNDLLTSADGGRSWHTVEFDRWYFIRELIPVKDSIWAVGPLGILKKERNGKTWQELATLPKVS